MSAPEYVDRTTASADEFTARFEPLMAADVCDEDTIERVARALWEADDRQILAIFPAEQIDAMWAAGRSSVSHRHYRRLARAAVAALKGTDTAGGMGEPADHPALRDALCQYLDDRADYADRGDLNADFDELWSYVAPVVGIDTAGVGYTVELGGQTYTQAQWEALQPYIEGRANADSEDAATWVSPDTTCECNHNRGSHDDIGNCWHFDQSGDEDCDCDQFRPAPDTAGHEWQCPSCGATTRARMADHDTAGVGDRYARLHDVADQLDRQVQRVLDVSESWENDLAAGRFGSDGEVLGSTLALLLHEIGVAVAGSRPDDSEAGRA